MVFPLCSSKVIFVVVVLIMHISATFKETGYGETIDSWLVVVFVGRRRNRSLHFTFDLYFCNEIKNTSVMVSNASNGSVSRDSKFFKSSCKADFFSPIFKQDQEVDLPDS